LITGTQYGSSDASGRVRKVRGSSDGRELTAIVPHYEVERGGSIIGGDETIGSGAIGVVRIDGKGRGFAGGAGLAIAKGRLETELMVLKSDVIGGYLGFRFRLWKGVFRPYIAIGFPAFVYHHDEVDSANMTTTTTRLAIGGRIAVGSRSRSTATSACKAMSDTSTSCSSMNTTTRTYSFRHSE